MGTAVWISILVVVVLIVLLALYLWVAYNSLVTLRARVDEAWRDIAQQMQRRAELVPGLVRTVQQYASHDKAAVDAVESARAETLAASTPGQATVAENHMQQSLKGMFEVASAYPKLTASPDFLRLQSDLGEVEEKIQASRRFYNGGVREFNNKVQVIPNSLFARRPGFGQREFFESADVARTAQPPKIQF